MHTALYKRICSQLRKRRIELGLTLAEAGKVIGVSGVQMHRIEKCQRRIDVIELRDLCRAYDLRMSDLLDE